MEEVALMHVARRRAAVLGQRHASKQRLKARRLNPVQRDSLWPLNPLFSRQDLRQAGLTFGLVFFAELPYMRRSFAP
jgi:hypothetical protein